MSGNVTSTSLTTADSQTDHSQTIYCLGPVDNPVDNKAPAMSITTEQKEQAEKLLILFNKQTNAGRYLENSFTRRKEQYDKAERLIQNTSDILTRQFSVKFPSFEKPKNLLQQGKLIANVLKKIVLHFPAKIANLGQFDVNKYRRFQDDLKTPHDAFLSFITDRSKKLAKENEELQQRDRDLRKEISSIQQQLLIENQKYPETREQGKITTLQEKKNELESELQQLQPKLERSMTLNEKIGRLKVKYQADITQLRQKLNDDEFDISAVLKSIQEQEITKTPDEKLVFEIIDTMVQLQDACQEEITTLGLNGLHDNVPAVQTQTAKAVIKRALFLFGAGVAGLIIGAIVTSVVIAALGVILGFAAIGVVLTIAFGPLIYIAFRLKDIAHCLKIGYDNLGFGPFTSAAQRHAENRNELQRLLEYRNRFNTDGRLIDSFTRTIITLSDKVNALIKKVEDENKQTNVQNDDQPTNDLQTEDENKQTNVQNDDQPTNDLQTDVHQLIEASNNSSDLRAETLNRLNREIKKLQEAIPPVIKDIKDLECLRAAQRAEPGTHFYDRNYELVGQAQLNKEEAQNQQHGASGAASATATASTSSNPSPFRRTYGETPKFSINKMLEKNRLQRRFETIQERKASTASSSASDASDAASGAAPAAAPKSSASGADHRADRRHVTIDTQRNEIFQSQDEKAQETLTSNTRVGGAGAAEAATSASAGGAAPAAAATSENAGAGAGAGVGVGGSSTGE